MPRRPTLIFVHIHKTGGVTLTSILKRHYSSAGIRGFNGPTHRSGQELRELPDHIIQNLGCIAGHVPFGLHRYLPGQAHYLTLIRNPVHRIVSAYYNALIEPAWGRYHRRIVEGRLSLREFVAGPASHGLNNGQTRMLIGLPSVETYRHSPLPEGEGTPQQSGGEADAADLPSDALEQARHIMDRHFIFVGLTERFDESLLLARRFLGWNSIHYRKRNVNFSRPRQFEIPRSTLAAIERQNAVDLELYDECRKRMDKLQLQDPQFSARLYRFKFMNRLYSSTPQLDHLKQWAF